MAYDPAFQSPPPSVVPEPTAPRANHKTLWILLFLLLGVFALLGAFSGYFSFSTQDEQNEGVTLMNGTDLPGILLLTLVHANEDPPVSALYQYFFADARVERLGWDLAAYDGLELTSMYSESPSGDWATFLGLRGEGADEQSLSASESSWQIYRADYSGVIEGDDFVKALQEAGQATNDIDIKGEVDVSDTGAILYVGFSDNPANSEEPVTVETGTIKYISDDSPAGQILTKGTDPEWIDSSHFAFLKDDGLYLFSLVDDTEKKLWDLPAPLTVRTSIAVSDNGEFIAIADNSVAEFLVLRLPTVESEVELASVLPVKGSYPVFAPDNSMVAFITVAFHDESDQEIPAITIYDLNSYEQRATIPFVDFEPGTAYITEWFF